MLERRKWVPDASEDLVQGIAAATARQDAAAVGAELDRLVEENKRIHDRVSVNLNPATNVMNPKAEAMLSAGLGSRPSLGYPGDKYEMGLEAIERIEVVAAELASEVFGARYAELRVPSGAIANLYVFMATANPGDSIIVPSSDIGGHVTHHAPGAAGLYGVVSHAAPIDPVRYTVDIDRLRIQARDVRPKLITIGGSLNLFPHPIAEIRQIADEVGAKVLFDAAHLSGMIAGKAWQQPLDEGAHAITMSTYKSLGGPPSGLIVTNDAELAERLDHIAYPGLTANFDAGKTAALAVTLLDWKVCGRDYAAMMQATARALAESLAASGIEIFGAEQGFTTSHQFALKAAPYGGGQNAAKLLRRANILSCGIGLPLPQVPGDINGLRLGTPEIARLGMTEKDMPALAALITRVLRGNEAPERVAPKVTEFRAGFSGIHFTR
jgi:glycine hydroxymethyltransferase